MLNFIKHIIVAILISSVLETFWLKDWDKCLILLQNQGYRAIICPLAMLLVFSVAPKKPRKSKTAVNDEKKVTGKDKVE